MVNKARERIGEKRIMSCGMEAEIEEYANANNLIVRFKDGSVVKHCSYKSFRFGQIHPPIKDHLGNEYPNTKAMCKAYGVPVSMFRDRIEAGKSIEEALSQPRMTTVWRKVSYKGQEYRSLKQCCIENGLSYWYVHDQVHRGVPIPIALEHAELKTPQSEDKYARLGMVKLQNNGLFAKIIEYNDSMNVAVMFEDGAIVHNRHYFDFNRGIIVHPKLRILGESLFHGFKTKYVIRSDSATYYSCTCQICNIEEVWTPQQMINHAKKHAER